MARTISKFIDRVQVYLLLAGFNKLAHFVGKFGSPLQLVEPTANKLEEANYDHIVDEADIEVRSGAGWSLDEFEVEPLRAIPFDPTFKSNPGIDIESDLVFPATREEVN